MRKILLFVSMGAMALLLTGVREARANVYEPRREGNSWDDVYYNDASVASFSSIFSGAGTAANPYLIKSANDLARLAWAVKNGVTESSAGKYFKLTVDINLNARKWGRIGHTGVFFRGTFDGDGHTISQMNISVDDSNRGLFGATDNATVKNLKMTNCRVYNPNQSFQSILIGYASGFTTIENCHISNSQVNGHEDLGGFVGRTNGGGVSISRSSSNVGIDTHGGGRVGGFVGSVWNSNRTNIISDCIYTGSMDNNDGCCKSFFVGEGNGTITITNCVAGGHFDGGTYGVNAGANGTNGFLIGNSGLSATVTNTYYLRESGINWWISLACDSWDKDWARQWVGNDYVRTTAAMNSQAMANTLNNGRTGASRCWEYRGGKLSNNTVNLTTTTAATTTITYPLYTFQVTIPQNSATWTYPKVTSGTVSTSSANQYQVGYLGNGVWELTATSEFLTVGKAETPYTIPNLSVVYDQWTKKITVSGSKKSGPANPGHWHLFKRLGTSGTWTWVADLGAAATFSRVEEKVAYDQTWQYGVRFVFDKDTRPATPEGYGGVVQTVSTVPDIKVGDFKAEGGTNKVCISFNVDSRLGGVGQYSLIRETNGTERYLVTGATFPVGKTAYSTDDNDVGASCNIYSYRVEITALESHKFISDKISGNAASNSYITEVAATKGEYTGAVRLSWTASGSDDASYAVWRRVHSSNAWSALTAKTTDKTYEDNKALPGIYYDYKVELYDKCDGATTLIGESIDIGFAQSLGTVLGRVTYGSGSGTAVEGVSVMAKLNDPDEVSMRRYYSLRSTGGGQTAVWRPEASYFNDIVDDDFTLQLYLSPDYGVTDTVLLARIGDVSGSDNAIRLYLKPAAEGYQIVSRSGPGTSKELTLPYVLPANRFTQVSIVRSGTQLTLCAVNDVVGVTLLEKATGDDLYTQTTFDTAAITLGHELRGNIDEVRFWGKALSDAVILRDYNHILSGGDAGLKCYWTFDGMVDGYFFDHSRTAIGFNNNHGTRTLASDAVRIPEDAQLSLKGITDAGGNYEIRGIPFSGEGASYDIVPVMGVHQFQPAKHLRFVSLTSLVHNGTDFTDISSFKVSGSVTYEGGDYPVEGVQLNVDGVAAVRNGQLVVTDGEGKFEVDVPIGDHYISLEKQGHTFASGRYPGTGVHDFQNNMSGLTFFDNTLVRVIGRVAGGDIETNKQLGFGLSKANIGKATITIAAKNDRYKLSTAAGKVEREFSLFTPYGSGSSATNKASFIPLPRGSQIEVETNPQTGEFAVELPPVPYNITGVTTAALNSQTSTFRFEKQSLEIDPSLGADTLSFADTLGNVYADQCHDMLRITYYSNPEFSVRDMGNPYGAFGDNLYVYEQTTPGASFKDTVSLYSVSNEKVSAYTAGYPVFSQLTGTYTWEISAFERYENLDGGDTVKDLVPLVGQQVNITNALASYRLITMLDAAPGGVAIDTVSADDVPEEGYQSSEHTVTLDKNGKAEYSFVTGFPNLGGDNLLSVDVNFMRNNSLVRWNNGLPEGELFRGYLLGQIASEGSNFTTQGTDHVDFVLHDPPGSRSYAYVEKGSTYSSEISNENTNSKAWQSGALARAGYTFKAAKGSFIFWMIDEIEVEATLGGSRETVDEYTSGTSSTKTTTLNQRISTSSDPAFVGSAADVYVGNSTNIVFGKVRDLRFYPETDVPADVTPTATVSGEKSYKLFPQEVWASGVTFGTTFNYSQGHILDNLIPNIENLRNQLITVVDILPLKDSIAWSTENTDPVYFTTLPRSDPSFGAKGSYTVYYNPQAEASDDKVARYNNWIAQWQNTIKSNEEYKLSLFDNRAAAVTSGALKNLSFNAAVAIENSITVSCENVKTFTDVHESNEVMEEEFGILFNDVGVTQKEEYRTNERRARDSASTTQNELVFGYELVAEGNEALLDAISVDVFAPFTDVIQKAVLPDVTLQDLHGFAFRTRAGQTSCPYEGEDLSKFYTKDGKPQVLNEGTFQIEKPELYINSSKEATAANVPSGREATFTLQLQNQSEVNQPVSYTLLVQTGSNPDGLIISMDGQPLNEPRTIANLEYGQEMVKTLKVKQGSNDVLDYSDIKIALASVCDESVSSEVSLNVHYYPSSTDVRLEALNTLANNAQGTKVNFRLSEFNRSFRGFAAIRLQYKNVNDHTWVTLHEFINDTTLIPLRSSAQELITDGVLSYVGDLSALVDGEYSFRALSVSILGSEEVTLASEEVRVTKDLSAPQLLGNPSPANGILTAGGEIALTFNENIRSAYVRDGNISVKSVLNGYKVNHSAALKLSGQPAITEASIALGGKSFSVEAWFERALGEAGTLVSHGETFSLGFDAANHLVVTFEGESFTSLDTLMASNWQYISFAYNNDAKTFNVYSLSGADTKTIFNGQLVSKPYAGAGRLYAGSKPGGADPFNGAVHNLSLWSRNRLLGDLSDKDEAKTGREQSLIGYWELTEGHGTVGLDKARGRHLIVPGVNSWYLNNVNKAVSFDGQSYLALNTANIPVTATESFSVEFWFRGAAQPGAATLFSCGDGVLDSVPAKALSVGFDESGKLTLRANGEAQILSTASYLDNTWRHFALNVLRSGSVIAYVDGVAVTHLPDAAAGQMARASILLGARQYRNSDSTTLDNYFRGELDEVRIWKSARTADIIRQDIHNRLTGAESGLVAYYPFEHTYTDVYSQLVTDSTFADCLNQPASSGLKAAGAATAVGNPVSSNEAPALKEARSLENVAHTWTASNNKIVVNITEPAYRVENATLEISVSDVLDLNDNPLAQPISWTAYVNMNRLKWNDEELSITKEYLDEATHEVLIANESGEEKAWTISQLPSWLSVSKTYGSLKPLSSDKLVFTIHPATPVGHYEDVIYLSGSNQIDVPLLISLKVTSQSPDWEVNPANFESSMSLIARLSFDGATSEDPEDIVAAFVNGICAGVASPIYYERYDATLVILDIYGNGDFVGKPITFKAWKAGTGRFYPVVSTGGVKTTFATDKLLGSVKAPVTLNGEHKVEQQIALTTGWNWISLNTNPGNLSVSSVFAPLILSADMVKSSASYAEPNGNSWASSLTTLEIGKMYKVKMKNPQLFTLAGDEVDPHSTRISISRNWNWIGYTPQVSLPLEDAFAEFEPTEGDVIKGQSKFAYYTSGAWVGSLTVLAPGKGYLYYSTERNARTLLFPSISAASSANSLMKSIVAKADPQPSTQWAVADEHKYPGNMTITAVVKDGSRTLTNCEVGVFAGSECRGAISSTAEGLIFLTVAGDESATLAFKVYDKTTKATFSVRQTFTYVGDDIYGNISNPHVIQLSDATGVDHLAAAGIRAYPTVVNGDFYVASERVALQAITVYSLTGSVVKQQTGLDSRVVTVNLSALSQGSYYVSIETADGKAYTVKIFVK